MSFPHRSCGCAESCISDLGGSNWFQQRFDPAQQPILRSSNHMIDPDALRWWLVRTGYGGRSKVIVHPGHCPFKPQTQHRCGPLDTVLRHASLAAIPKQAASHCRCYFNNLRYVRCPKPGFYCSLLSFFMLMNVGGSSVSSRVCRYKQLPTRALNSPVRQR